MDKNTYDDKIYWYYLDIVERSNVIIDKIEKVNLETGRICYKVYYNVKYKPGEFIIFIGEKGTGIELSGSQRYIVDGSGELDIIGINTYLYNRKMLKVLNNL